MRPFQNTFQNTSAALLTATLIAWPITVPAAPPAVKPPTSIRIPDSKGRFDIVRLDSKRHRLLGAHQGDKTADIFDLTSNTLVKRIPLGAAVDTAISADSKYYYFSVADAQRVAVVDADSLAEVASIKLDGPTDAILYEPKNRKIYVSHDDGTNLWVIDSATRTLTGSVTIPGAPEFMEYDPGADRIYLNIKTTNSVVMIDPAINQVVAQWPTAPALSPHGLALDSAHHLLFVAGGNGKLVALDSTSGQVVASANITEKVDQIAYDARNGRLYCAGSGKMTVLRVNGRTLTPAGEIATAATARDVVVDASGAPWSTYTDGSSSFATSWALPQE